MTRVEKEAYEAELAAMRAEIEELRKHKEGALSTADQMMGILKEKGIDVADDLRQTLQKIKRGDSCAQILCFLPYRTAPTLPPAAAPAARCSAPASTDWSMHPPLVRWTAGRPPWDHCRLYDTTHNISNRSSGSVCH
jgi:hypothetical protein